MFKELKENEIKKDGDSLSLSDIVKLDKENIKITDHIDIYIYINI